MSIKLLLQVEIQDTPAGVVFQSLATAPVGVSIFEGLNSLHPKWMFRLEPGQASQPLPLAYGQPYRMQVAVFQPAFGIVFKPEDDLLRDTSLPLPDEAEMVQKYSEDVAAVHELAFTRES